jgi:hypothetical protein
VHEGGHPVVEEVAPEVVRAVAQHYRQRRRVQEHVPWNARSAATTTAPAAAAASNHRRAGRSGATAPSGVAIFDVGVQPRRRQPCTLFHAEVGALLGCGGRPQVPAPREAQHRQSEDSAGAVPAQARCQHRRDAHRQEPPEWGAGLRHRVRPRAVDRRDPTPQNHRVGGEGRPLQQPFDEEHGSDGVHTATYRCHGRQQPRADCARDQRHRHHWLAAKAVGGHPTRHL